MNVNHFLSVHFAIASALAAVSGAIAEPLDHWQLRYPPEGRGSLSGFTYGNGLFVGVGTSGSWPNNQGIVAFSTNGENWVVRGTGVKASPKSVAFGNGTFVAVGSTYTGSNYVATVLTSTDGVDWVSQNVGTGQQLVGVIYAGGIFVAVGSWAQSSGALVFTSQDGSIWSQQYYGPGRLYSVAHGNDTFVAMGDTIVTSTNGITWVARGSRGEAQSVAYGNGLFIAPFRVAPFRTAFLTSSNGIHWRTNAPDLYPCGDEYNPQVSSIAFGNGAFVVNVLAMRFHEDEHYYCSYTLVSTNALDWRTTGFGMGTSVNYCGGVFATASGTAGLWTSLDGFQWINRSPIPVNPLNSVAHGGGRFIAAGESGTLLSSHDGTSWTSGNPGTSHDVRCITYSDGRFIAVGHSRSTRPDAIVFASTDDATWPTHAVQTNAELYGVAFGNGTWVAVGRAGPYFPPRKGLLLSSTNGFDWVPQNAGVSNWLQAIAYGNGQFVIVGVTNTGPRTLAISLSSTNGVSWTRGILSSNASVFWPQAIAYGNGRFVTVSPYQSIHTSTDGINWEKSPLAQVPEFHGIAYGSGFFVIVGDRGSVLTSSDGIAWMPRISRSYEDLRGVAYGNGCFIAVGGYYDPNRSVILQSGSFAPAELRFLSRPNDTGVELTVTGEIGRTYRLQGSTALSPTNWIDLASFTLTQTTTNVLDPSATNFPQRFYRALSP